jgi:hypothetical protein
VTRFDEKVVGHWGGSFELWAIFRSEIYILTVAGVVFFVFKAHRHQSKEYACTRNDYIFSL